MNTSVIVILSIVGYIIYSAANLAAFYYCIKLSKRFRRMLAKFLNFIEPRYTSRSYEAGMRLLICQGALFRNK